MVVAKHCLILIRYFSVFCTLPVRRCTKTWEEAEWERGSELAEGLLNSTCPVYNMGELPRRVADQFMLCITRAVLGFISLSMMIINKNKFYFV